MDYVAGGMVAFFATIVLLPQLMHVSERLGLVDHPAQRKVHVRPIPVCGGIAMVCGVCIALALFGMQWTVLMPYCLGAGLLVVVGLLDDLRDIGYRLRLACQLVAALIVAIGGTTLHHLPFFTGPAGSPLWLDVAATTVFIVAVTNAVNLLDGLDGLAGGCVLLSLLAIGFVGDQTGGHDATLLAAVVGAAVLAFLRYNTHPALVFMGDAGSTFLGFTLAVVAVMTVGQPTVPVSRFALLPLIGLPVVDTLKVFCERLIHGRSPFTADRRHLHHRLLAAGLHHKQVVITLYLLQGAMVFGGALLHDHEPLLLAGFFVVAAALTIFGIELAARRHFGVRHKTRNGDRHDVWVQRWRWLQTASRKAVAYGIAAFLVVGAAAPGRISQEIAILAASLALVVLLERRFVGRFADVLRFGVLGTVVLVGCQAMSGPAAASPVVGAVIAVLGAVLAALLALAIHVCQQGVFPVSPQDVLLGIIAVGTLAAIATGLVDARVAGPAMALVTALFGCTYLLADQHASSATLRHATLASLLIVAGRGILS